MRLLPRSLVVLLGAVALLLTGLGAPAGAAASYDVPVVGSCHSYGFAGLRKPTDPSPAVPCTGPHTALTVAVITIRGTDFDRATAGRGLKRCYQAIAATLGVDPVRTAYSIGFFYPTKAEVAKGARWVRCDLILYAGRTLAPLADPVITDVTDDRVARCILKKRQRFLTTPCASPHTYRVSGGYQAKGGRRYPGNDTLFEQALRRCASQVVDPSDYYVNFPVEGEWAAGYRAVVCLSRQST